jgi:hypothetical protein
MPVTFVRDPVTGITYSVNISGSTPTEQESARIDQFLASQRTLSVLPQAQPVEEEEIDRTAFGRGFVREPFQRERSFGVVEEALADTAFGKFFGFDAEEARAKQEAAEAELRRLELEDPSIRFEDITGLGTAASVSGEALGGEARDMAIQAGAMATGAGIGGLFFGAGAAPGAAIGRTAGVAYTTAQAAPQMLAEAIEAQKEEGNEVNLTKALGATAINLLSEFVTDYFVIGKLIPKEAKSKVGSAVRSAIEAGTAEGAIEVFQQAVIRGQAGQDLTSPEAIAEYAESLYSGMTVGGTIGGVGGFLSTPDRSAQKAKDDELDQDRKELEAEGSARLKFADQTEREIEEDRAKALASTGIDPDAPLGRAGPQQRLALPEPETVDVAPETAIADEEFANLSFNKAQYERVLQQVKADITRSKPQPAPQQAEVDVPSSKPQPAPQKAEVDVPSSKPQPAPQQAEVDVPSSETLSKPVSNPINIPAIHQRVKADIPGITVSQVRDIMKELQARGFIAENPASKKNKFIPMGSLAPEVKTPDVSYRRQIDTAADFIKADQTRLERLQYDLRSAEAYGRNLEGNRVTPNQVNAKIASIEQSIAKNQKIIEFANQRLKTLGRDTHVPRIERVGLPPNMKAVPVAEGTPDALRPRFEAQQAGIRGMKEQISSVNKQVRKLNEQAKKRTLSSIELDRMQKLQEQQADLSTRLGEAQANLKTPEKIFQEAKNEQIREQERQREIERKLAAARARAAADQVKAQEDQDVSPFSPAFNAKQANVFGALRKRLTNLGLKDVRLEGAQRIEGAEGSFDPVTKVLSLAMGLYDPKMTDQQLFDAISEVMNHEVIHALRAMGLLKPNEIKVLERFAGKTKYVKRTKDGTQKRNYTYLDRAKNLYSDLTPTQQKEEAIAEMFRDYVAGRLKLGGGPRSLFEKIKKFFKSLIGANVDNGFNSVEDIFQGIRRGEIGARDRVAPAAPATQPAAAAPMQSRLTAMPKNIAAAVSTSDDYMQDAPADQRPLFSRIPRSPMVAGLREFIKNNPDGFTIDATTFDPAAGGFVVAPLKEAEIIVGQDLPEEVLLGYVEDNKDIARASGRTVYLGGWFDGESQQYFLDNTLIVPTAEEALYIAEAADQLAIFDLNNFEEIRTNAGIERLKQSGTYRSDAAVGYQRNLAEVGRRFAQARDQRRARIQEQLVGGLKRPLESRLFVPLTPEQRAASIIDYLDPNTGKPLFKKKPGSETLVSFANKLLELRGTRSYDIINSEEDRREVAQIMAAEAEAALLSSRDALGWYDSTLKLAKQILYPVYPEISPTRPDGTPNSMHDPAAEHAFDYATAVTSNGLAVVDNYQFASEQYDAWKASPDGKFTVVGKGDQGGSMLKAFEFWNALVDRGYNSSQAAELLTTQLPRSEVNRVLKDVFGVTRQNDLPAKADTKEEASTIVSIAYVIGPKIGNGFYQNLRGNFDPLTMDRWWMRFVNRITGNPLVVYTEEGLGKSLDRVWNLVKNPKGLSKMEREMLRRAQENLNMTKLEKSDTALLSGEIEKVWNSTFNKAYNDKLRELLDEGMDFEIVRGSVRGPMAAEAKRLARQARPAKPELALASTNLTKKVKPALEEAPRDALDRTAMRDVANRARRILRENNQIAANLTNADFQALMWYAEKRIFDAGGVKRGRGEDNDYADGAIAIAKKKGISNAKIEAALPEAERVRVRSVESQLAGDQDAGSRVGELVREPQEGDFFSPRRLTLVAENDTIEANMTPQERAEIREALEGVEIDPEMPRPMYSRIPVAEAYMPTRAPVDSKAGPTPIYGSIMEDGRLLPVVLPKGSHRVYENGVEVGNGLFHIQQRQHDRELIENSKYKRVENSIYDLMRRWQNQGYDDGESVIGYNSRDDLVLEWRNNLAFSAPPMRLVLERGSNVQGAPLADAYYVKTFFLILDKEDRAAPERRNQKRRLYSRLYSTTAQLAPQVQQKKQNLTYARSADFLAKGLGVVLPKNRAQETADTFLRKFQDNMLPVGRMIQELQAKGLTITDAMDTYLKEELFHGIVGEKITRREETIYKNALDAVKGFNITSGMIDGLQAVSDTASPGRDGFVKQARETARSEKLAMAEAYLYAKHAKERNAYIRTINPNLDSGSGMTDAEADAILRWFTGLDAGNTAAVRALDAATRKIVEDTNNVRVESGLIPSEFDQVLDEDGDVIERPNYNFYVPLRGIVDPEAAESDGTAARAGSGQRFGGKGRPDPRALGRYKYATDVLATLINQNQQSVSRGERNKVGQSFLQLLRADPATTKAYAEILPRTPTRRALVGKRVREITDFNAAQDPNIFVVKEDGKDVYVELSDVNLGAALKGDNGVGAGALGSIVRTMGKINRYLANINTSYNPEFFITNFLRDLQTAGVNIQQFDGDGLTTQIVKDVRSALGGIKRSIRNKDDSSEWSQIYKDFVSAGGQNVTNQMSTVADQMENIRGLVGDVADQGARGKWNQVKNSFVGKGAGSFLSFIEDYNTVIENGIRVATYKALLDRGFTRERAAQAARNVTVNFAKGGEYKNFMNAFYLFYNASLQGSFAMLNAALRSRKVQRIWAGVIAAGLLQDQLNALLSEEEEDGLKQYDKIPDYILHHNFILPDPFGFTERSYIAIPMPYGLNMAHNIGRATSRALRGGYDAGEATSSIVGTIVDTINPLGGTENFANFVAPTVVDPFIDVMQNEDFAGKPIFKEAFPGDRSLESQRYWSTTNPSAIWVAQNINSLTGGTSAIPGFIDLSPDVMNFWLEFATGGVGRFVQRTAELPIRVFDEGLDEEIYREIPFVRKIIGSVSSREDYGRYIEKRDEILLAGEELKEAVDNQDRERALAARERFAEELRYLPRVRAVDNAIRKVNRQMNQVRDNRNLSDERRREIMDRLDERKQLLISRGNQFLADY